MPEMNESPSGLTQYPLLPLRDVVVFPHMVIPLFVGRPKSIKAMETAMEAGKNILLVAQKRGAHTASATHLTALGGGKPERRAVGGGPPAEIEAMRRALLSAFDQYVKL